MDSPPSNPTAFAEAQAAAGGDTVKPVTGVEVTPDMVLFHNGRWLPVRFKSPVGEMIRLDFAVDDPNSTPFRFTSPDAELYRRIEGCR